MNRVASPTKINALRGTQDHWGKEAKIWEAVEQKAVALFERFGYQPIRTPLIESASLFLRSIGAQTDIVQKEMYTFKDRSDQQISLRPEATASVVRAYVEHSLDKQGGLCKFYYLGPMFRGERPQAGRLRQFHQMGVEVLGSKHPHADTEVLLCVVSLLEHLGVKKFNLKLNNLGSFEERLSYQKALKSYFEPKMAKLCSDCQNRLDKNVFRILDCKEEGCRKEAQSSPVMIDFVSKEDKAHFETVTFFLEKLGVAFQIDPRMVRGLDYYTRTVFEVTHPDLGSKDALLAGGRYDSLISELGGQDLGAVGFALGLERLLMILEKNGISQDIKLPSVCIVTLGKEGSLKGFEVARELRNKGIVVHADLEEKSLKAQLRQADRLEAQLCLIIGEDEIKKGKAVLKDMAKSTQEEIALKQVADEIVRKVSAHV